MAAIAYSWGNKHTERKSFAKDNTNIMEQIWNVIADNYIIRYLGFSSNYY